jgi:hypothetical protein
MEDLQTRIKIRFEHAAARKTLAEKYHSRMLFAHSGGMWKAGPELLSLLDSCQESSAVILDMYETPVQVDVSELKILAHQRWQEQMTAWLIEWTELQRQR